jgi:hypothetical protein
MHEGAVHAAERAVPEEERAPAKHSARLGALNSVGEARGKNCLQLGYRFMTVPLINLESDLLFNNNFSYFEFMR